MELMHSRYGTVVDLERLEDDGNWVATEKFDGWRQVLVVTWDGSIRLQTRTGVNTTDNVPHITGVRVPDLAGSTFDCEGLGPKRDLGSTTSVFGSLPETAVAFQKRHGLAELIIFDVIRLKGVDVTRLPLEVRHQFIWKASELLRIFGDHKAVNPERWAVDGFRELYDGIVARGGEGVMLKHREGRYLPGRAPDSVLRVKAEATWDAVITGFTEGAGKYEGMVGALRYGFFVDGGLQTTGSSSGFTDQMRQAFTERPEDFVGQVVELGGNAMNHTGAIRHPRFKRLRDDKQAEECRL